MTDPLSPEEIDERFASEIARLHAENATLTVRVSDLKLALGDNAGWFDRAMAAKRERDRLRAENAKLRERVEKLERACEYAQEVADDDGFESPSLPRLRVALAACEEGSK